jgi:PEP-CTERM motif-containing protein
MTAAQPISQPTEHSGLGTNEVDLFVIGNVTESQGPNEVHIVTGATVPEPATWLLVTVGLCLLGLARATRVNI